ncbi:MAG: hypothetical protein ACRDN1_04240 [Trebonia sp.]
MARAIGVAERWARTGASPGELLSTGHAALDSAVLATADAERGAARARMLFRCAPRGRAASFGTSRAITAWLEWRAADHGWRLARAAADLVRAAAEADDVAVPPGSGRLASAGVPTTASAR